MKPYAIVHAKERHLNIIEEPKVCVIPKVGSKILVKETYTKGNERLNLVECIVKEVYSEVIRVEVIRKINSKTSKEKIYTYSECFRKLDFQCGFLSFKYL